MTKNHGDIEILSSVTSCSFRFAKSVLLAIEEGFEDSLLNRDRRCDSIKATDWPNTLADYVFQTENTRATPGKDTVSVR